MEEHDLYSGLIRLHILHHAAHEPIFGLGIIEELARHGYKLSAGTLYPILHRLELHGYLKSRQERAGKRLRRTYRATPKGLKALENAKEKVRELFGELFEDQRGGDRAGRTSGPRAVGSDDRKYRARRAGPHRHPARSIGHPDRAR